MKNWECISDSEQEKVREHARSILTDLLFCTRVWEAWEIGTMSKMDFIMAEYDYDIVENTARYIFDVILEGKQ